MTTYPEETDIRKMRIAQVYYYDPTAGQFSPVSTTAGLPIAFPTDMVVTREDGQKSLAVDTEIHLDAATLNIDNILVGKYYTTAPTLSDGDQSFLMVDDRGHLQVALEDTSHTRINPATEDTLSLLYTDVAKEATLSSIDSKVATEATLSSVDSKVATETTLSSIDSKVPSQGQAPMANSVPVAIANDQSEIPVGDAAARSSLSSIDGKVATEATLSSANSRLSSIESNQTNGNQLSRITDGTDTAEVRPGSDMAGGRAGLQVDAEISASVPIYSLGSTDGVTMDDSHAAPIYVDPTTHEVYIRDDTARSSLSSIDGKVATESTLSSIDSKVTACDTNNVAGTVGVENTVGTQINPATEDTLSNIDGKVPPQGQATMANSVPVTIASDQTTVPVYDGTLENAVNQIFSRFTNTGVSQTFANPTNPSLSLDTEGRPYVEVYVSSINGGATVNIYGSLYGTVWHELRNLSFTTDATTKDGTKGFINGWKYIMVEVIDSGTGDVVIEISANR